ncbi:hypothetical protein MPLSOD_160093 [Mesorhizobium sp. SOD10]|nr:hypothetical protein MPLSOD_160093 [Mesorhizobium sp. SOD10]
MFLVLGAWNLSSMIGLQAFRALDCLRAWLSASIIDMVLSFQGECGSVQACFRSDTFLNIVHSGTIAHREHRSREK